MSGWLCASLAGLVAVTDSTRFNELSWNAQIVTQGNGTRSTCARGRISYRSLSRLGFLKRLLIRLGFPQRAFIRYIPKATQFFWFRCIEMQEDHDWTTCMATLDISSANSANQRTSCKPTVLSNQTLRETILEH